MALFKVGDHVERVGVLVPVYMKYGRIVRVIPESDLPENLTKYEVDFESRRESAPNLATFYEIELRLVVDDPSVWS